MMGKRELDLSRDEEGDKEDGSDNMMIIDADDPFVVRGEKVVFCHSGPARTQLSRS